MVLALQQKTLHRGHVCHVSFSAAHNDDANILERPWPCRGACEAHVLLRRPLVHEGVPDGACRLRASCLPRVARSTPRRCRASTASTSSTRRRTWLAPFSLITLAVMIGSQDYLRENGYLAFNQVPLLRIDGLNLVQSQAIVRYLARKHHLYGENDKEAAEFVDTC